MNEVKTIEGKREDKLPKRWYHAVFILILFILFITTNNPVTPFKQTKITTIWFSSHKKDTIDYNFKKMSSPTTTNITKIQIQELSSLDQNESELRVSEAENKIRSKQETKGGETEEIKNRVRDYLAETEEIIETVKEGNGPKTWVDPLNFFVDYPVNSYSHHNSTKRFSSTLSKSIVSSPDIMEVYKGIVLR